MLILTVHGHTLSSEVPGCNACHISLSFVGSSSFPRSVYIDVSQFGLWPPSIYINSVSGFARPYDFKHHIYINSSQVYSSSPDLFAKLQTQDTSFSLDISHWMSSTHLKLNLTKTEILVFFSRPLLPDGESPCQMRATLSFQLLRLKTLGSCLTLQLPCLNYSHLDSCHCFQQPSLLCP